MTEIWKDIVDYDGTYQVSNLGHVKTFMFNKGRLLHGSVNQHGYRVVNLRKNGVSRKHFVHRLVAEAFIYNPNCKPFINHIDCNPLNNEVSNLEWCTQAENVHYTMHMGRSVNVVGEQHGKSKLSSDDIIKIREAWDMFHNYSKIGRMFSVNPGTIWAIINNKTWRDVH